MHALAHLHFRRVAHGMVVARARSNGIPAGQHLERAHGVEPLLELAELGTARREPTAGDLEESTAKIPELRFVARDALTRVRCAEAGREPMGLVSLGCEATRHDAREAHRCGRRRAAGH